MNLERDELYLNPHIYISRSEIHRWGVFAEQDIAKFDVLQESPYCTFPYKELKKRGDVVVRYTYDSYENPGTDDLVDAGDDIFEDSKQQNVRTTGSRDTHFTTLSHL